MQINVLCNFFVIHNGRSQHKHYRNNIENVPLSNECFKMLIYIHLHILISAEFWFLILLKSYQLLVFIRETTLHCGHHIYCTANYCALQCSAPLQPIYFEVAPNVREISPALFFFFLSHLNTHHTIVAHCSALKHRYIGVVLYTVQRTAVGCHKTRDNACITAVQYMRTGSWCFFSYLHLEREKQNEDIKVCMNECLYNCQERKKIGL